MNRSRNPTSNERVRGLPTRAAVPWADRKGMTRGMDVLVLEENFGLCFLDGEVHEVRLNLDAPVARRVRALLEARDGKVLLELALDKSGKGRIVTVR